jgi:hypothetical protein
MQVPKKRPRGRPWPKGVSGHPGGRPKGARNKLSLMVEAGIARAVAELSRPLMIDKTKPYETWSDCHIQDGVRFRRDTLQRWNPTGPIPTRPERLSNREYRLEVMWKGRRYWSQRGWLFDPATRMAVKI